MKTICIALLFLSSSLLCFTQCVPLQADIVFPNSGAQNDEFVMQCSDSPLDLRLENIVDYDTTNAVFWIWMIGNQEFRTHNLNGVYLEKGIYDVKVVLLDHSGCEHMLHWTKKLLISESVTNSYTYTTCAGNTDSFEIIAPSLPVVGQSIWSSQQQVALELADASTQNFTIEVSGYAPGTTITSCEDLVSVFANFEHSYGSELRSMIICPNGSSTTLDSIQPSLNAVFGEPVDQPTLGPNTFRGNPFLYSWEDNSALPYTLDINNPEYQPMHPYTDLAYNYINFRWVVPGEYRTRESYCNLVGCPVNGTWTLRTKDVYFGDDGWLYNWGVQFGENIESLATEFSPTTTPSTWSGDVSAFIFTEESLSPTIGLPGTYSLQHTSTTEAGCTIQSIYDIIILENTLNVDAGPDMVISADNHTLAASVIGSNNITFEWTPNELLSDPNSLTPDVYPSSNTCFTLSAIDLNTGCQAEDEVCIMTMPLTIAGEIFNDLNGNGIRDNEPGIPLALLSQNNGELVFSTDENGNFTANSAYSVFSYDLIFDENNWIATTPTHVDITSLYGGLVFVSFGLQSTNPAPQIELSSNVYGGTCDQSSQLTIGIRNVGSTNISGEILAQLDNLLGVLSIENSEATIDGNLVHIPIVDLNPGQILAFNVEVQMPNVSHIGESIVNNISFLLADSNEIIGEAETSTTLTCAYDPNAIEEATAQGELRSVLPNSDLLYTIHFQNTGTDIAYNVNLQTTISENLNSASIRMLNASHPFTYSIAPEGELNIFFPNAMLQPQLVSEELSKGFVTFSIAQISNLPNGTFINQTASIVFDQNPPITTNTVSDMVLDCSQTTGEIYTSDQVICYEQYTTVGYAADWYTSLTWDVPGVGTVTSDALTFIPSETGDITLTATDGFCVVELQTPVVIMAIETPTFILTGDAVCEGDEFYATTSAVGEIAWIWNGEVVGSGNNFSGNASGTLSMTASQDGCTSPVFTYTIDLNAPPALPSIIEDGNLLTASSSDQGTYQWYFNGETTAIATGNSIEATQSGSYTCVFTNSTGCSSSSTIEHQQIGVFETNAHSFEAYPNPSSGLCQFRTLPGAKTFILYNSAGMMVQSWTTSATAFSVDLSTFAKGLYYISCIQPSAQAKQLKLILE